MKFNCTLLKHPLEACRGIAASLYIKVTGYISAVAKDFANRCTDMVFIYSKASYRYGEGF